MKTFFDYCETNYYAMENEKDNFLNALRSNLVRARPRREVTHRPRAKRADRNRRQIGRSLLEVSSQYARADRRAHGTAE